MSCSKRLALALVLAGTAPAAGFTDPGFEGIGASIGNGSSFPPYPTFNNDWTANQTDGEVFATAPGRPAHSGTWYADLLQNAGGNPNLFWDETTFTFGNYDRILTLVPVAPSTTYSISFYHAGGDRFGYVGFNTLVQVQSMQTAAAQAFQSATPGLYQWTLQSHTFTTDATTTQLALQFSPIGLGNASVLIDDISVSIVPEPGSLAALVIGCAAAVHRRRAQI